MVWPIMESRYVRRGSVGKSMKAVGLAVSQKGCWRKIALVLKKSPSWCLRGRQQQGYKQTRVSDAAGNRHSRRLAAYDGATRPFGVAVLLLPHRRSGSSKPLVTFRSEVHTSELQSPMYLVCRLLLENKNHVP